MRDEQILPFIVITIIAMISFFLPGGKKRSTRQPEKELPRDRRPGRKTAPGMRPAPPKGTPSVIQTAPVAREEHHEGSLEGEDPCHEDMLRPRPGQMHFEEAGERLDSAGEGEDPCHPGNSFLAAVDEVHREEDAVPERTAQERILDGIIFAEVLKRPRDRRRERSEHLMRKVEHGR